MDVIYDALSRGTSADPFTLGMAFLAGGVTSIGPCVAPRYLAAVGLLGREPALSRRIAILAAFLLGTVMTYVLTAFGGSFLLRLVNASSYAYLAIAAVLVIMGLRELRGDDHRCRATEDRRPALGGAFFLSASSSLVMSPCCTPLLLAFGAANQASSSPIALLAMTMAFACGHLAPLAIALCAVQRADGVLGSFRVPVATVRSGITIALGLYYAVLA